MKRTTDEEFRLKAAQSSPNVILLSQYERLNKKVECRCRNCGYEWSAAPIVLLRGNGSKKGGGCPKCADRIKKTDAQFAAELRDIRPNIILESKYLGANKPIRCRCAVCGYTWETTPHVLLKPCDSNCPNEAGNKQKTTDEFKKQIQALNPNIEILSPYVTARKRIRCRCMIHHYEWTSTPDGLLSHPRCRKCANDKLRAERARSLEEFRELLFGVNPQIEIIGKYVNEATHIACRCNRCSHEWTAMPVNLLAGNGCPVCAGTMKLTRKEMNRRLKAINSDYMVIGKYRSRKEKTEVECLNCGRQVKMTPENLLHGAKCACRPPSYSSPQEKYLADLLEAVLEEKPLRRDRQLIGAELDIVFPKHKIAIEPGAWYYHQDKLEHDQWKREACAKIGIRLITVYYGVNGEYESNERDVLLIDSVCVTEKDKEDMGQRLMGKLGILNNLLAS